MCVAFNAFSMLNPAALPTVNPKNGSGDFWLRLLNDQALRNCGDLEKLVIGCEIIAALDEADLLAA